MSRRATPKSAPHYQKIVYWSEEDRCFVGQCPALFAGGVHGDAEAAVYADLCRAVEEHLAILAQEGAKLPPADPATYTGKLTLRIKPEVHRALAVRAAARGHSLNQEIEAAIRKGLVAG